jgi:acetoin utilization deacetylase AcuC-like enzyme
MKPRAKTLFVTHEDCLGHDMGPGHHESPERLKAILRRLDGSGTMATLERVDAPLCVDDGPILRAHDAAYWRELQKKAPRFARQAVAPEAIMSRGSMAAIRRGVGGALLAVERVVGGENPNAFVAIRPPGHHALRGEAMGFCFVANAAVAAHRALDMGLSRVAIVDIDVHHGNGTEDVVGGDSRILMASTFARGIYPGGGEIPRAANMANLPLPPKTAGASMRMMARSMLFPALDAFAPELVVVSAGYDAHKDDPLGNQLWDDDDYGWWFEELQELANRHAKGRLVAILEGGYDLDALARSVERSIVAMRDRAMAR